jgi:cytochrome P450
MPPTEFTFVPFDPQFMRDPYPVYEQMRKAGRILRCTFGPTSFWIVHQYEDVRQLHTLHDAFSIAAGVALIPVGADQGPGLLRDRTMLTTDPPDHERLRRVVQTAFTPRSIAALESRVRDIAEQLLMRLAKGEPFDIVADFAAPLPTIVIAELMGIPEEDGARFRMMSETVTGTDVSQQWDGAQEARQVEIRRVDAELRQYLIDQIERKRTQPSDDLIGRMVEANRDNIMTDAEVVDACVLLLFAGNETTMRLIANMTLALGRHPDQRDLLVRDQGLIPNAVEETLRYDGPVQLLMRGSKRATDLAGVDIPAGQIVLGMLGAANRDPEHFTDPDTFDVTRKESTHIAFGHGIHYCLGAPLARREARIAFEALLEAAPYFKLLTADDELCYESDGALRSPKSLVITKG